MQLLPKLRVVQKVYGNQPLRNRLFIMVRALVCPWQKILRHIGRDGTVLDIGCGHGLLLHLIKTERPAMQCFGVDHDAHKIAIATAAAGTGPQFSDTPELRGLAPASCDFVTLIDVLYAVPVDKWSHILDLARQYLKPDGRLIIKETVNTPFWKFALCMLQEKIAIDVLRYTKGHPPRLESVAYYLQTLQTSGFKIITHHRVDQGYIWPHYLFVAHKKTC